MAKVMVIGVMLPSESKSRIGHTACTLGGVNYESKGSAGCIRGSRARGAMHPLFRHRFHLVLTDAQAAQAKKYADSCVGQPYVWGGVPTGNRGGDCSGFMSGIVCAATGRKLGRLFATASFASVAKKLGFAPGVAGGLRQAAKPGAAIGVMDRPFPGFPIEKNGKQKGHIKWVQARLNFAARNKHAVLNGKSLLVDGDFGDDTLKVVKAFQKKSGLEGLGMCGPKTWRKLNAVR